MRMSLIAIDELDDRPIDELDDRPTITNQQLKKMSPNKRARRWKREPGSLDQTFPRDIVLHTLKMLSVEDMVSCLYVDKLFNNIIKPGVSSDLDTIWKERTCRPLCSCKLNLQTRGCDQPEKLATSTQTEINARGREHTKENHASVE